MSEHDKYIDYDVVYKADLRDENAKLEQQLAIAVEALKAIKNGKRAFLIRKQERRILPKIMHLNKLRG